MKKTTLLSQQDVKDWLPWSANLDAGWWVASALNVQYAEALCLLGIPLIQEIQLQRETNALTAANAELLAEAAPWLANLTAFYAIPGLRVRLQAAGALVSQAREAAPAVLEDLDRLTTDHARIAEVYKELFLAWLKDNADAYPLLPTHTNCNSCATTGTNIAGFHFNS